MDVWPLSFSQPWLLVCLPLALLPLFFSAQPLLSYSSLSVLPTDRLSSYLDILLRLCSVLAIVALLLGLAGLFQPPQTIEYIGKGAHMVVLLDRSSSMDRPFAGDAGSANTTPMGTASGYASKGQIARRLLAEFAARRNQDMFGMLVFSTNPIQTLPLTDKQGIIQAAIAAGDSGRGLAKTNLGQGLIAALEFFAGQPYTGSRIVLLISDGGARLNLEQQERIENLMRRHRVALYWIYIRSKNSPGLDTPLSLITAAEIAPEQLLHRFFQALNMPYRAYSAENPALLQEAINDVSQLQNLPIRYQEVLPKRELSQWCYGIALLLSTLCLLAKLFELKTWEYSEH